MLIFWTIVVDGLVGLSGGLLSERWLIRHQASLVGFAAGAILGAVFLDILPESVNELGVIALTWSFCGFLVLAMFEWLIGHHHHKDGIPPATLPPGLLLSDALHNLGDGAAIAAGFLISVQAGIAVAIAVIAHEVPQEVGDYAILRAAGWTRKSALLALAGVQLTAFVGAAAVIGTAEHVKQITAIILAIAAGTFLYIGATDLLPEIHSAPTRSSRLERMLGFLIGIVAIALVTIAERSH